MGILIGEEKQEKESAQKSELLVSSQDIHANERELRSGLIDKPLALESKKPNTKGTATPYTPVKSPKESYQGAPGVDYESIAAQVLEPVKRDSALGAAMEAAAKEKNPLAYANSLYKSSKTGYDMPYIRANPDKVDQELKAKELKTGASLAHETVKNFYALDEFQNGTIFGEFTPSINQLKNDTDSLRDNALDADLQVQTGNKLDHYKREDGSYQFSPFAYDPRSNVQRGLKSSWIQKENMKIGGEIIQQGYRPTQEQLQRLNYLESEAQAFTAVKGENWLETFAGETVHGMTSQEWMVGQIGVPAAAMYGSGKLVKFGSKYVAPATGPWAPAVIGAGEGIDKLAELATRGIVVERMFDAEQKSAVSTLSQMSDSEGNPLDPDVVRLYGTLYGGASAALEAISLGRITKLMPGQETIGKLFGKESARKTLAEMAKNPKMYAGVLPIAKKYAKRMAEGAATEGLTEALQELTMIWSEEGAMASQEARSQTGATFERQTFDDKLERTIASGKMGAQVGMGFVGAGATLGIAGDYKAARRAKENIQVWKRAQESLGGDLKAIYEANPEKTGEMFEEVIFADRGQTHQFFDIDDFNEVLGDKAGSYAQALGLDPEELQKAKESGQSLRIPIRKFVEVFGGSEYFQGMAEKGRFNEGDMSAAEADEFEAAHQKQGPQADPVQVAEEKKIEEGWNRIYQQMGLEYRQAGRPDKESDMLAQMTADSYVARAKRVGMTPEEYVKRRPIDAIKGKAPRERVGSQGDFELGSLSEKYESNGDPGTVAPDSVGTSYGSWQMNSANGIPDHFVEWLGKKNKPFYQLLKNSGAVDSEGFQKAWKDLAAAHPRDFKSYQRAYIKETHYDPGAKTLLNGGFDASKRSKALQDVLWSNAVQHGGVTGASALSDAAAAAGKNLNDMTDREIIQGVYDVKISNPAWTEKIPNQEGVNAVHGRWRAEQAEALSKLGQEQGRKGTLRGAPQLSTQAGVNIDGLDKEHLNAVNLVGDEIKQALGLKGVISSGYRDPGKNAGANGQENSWHTQGKAVDLVFDRDLTAEEVKKVEQVAKKYGFGEVLYHDAGSGMHLHMGNLNKSFYQAITENVDLDSSVDVMDLTDFAEVAVPHQKDIVAKIKELTGEGLSIPKSELDLVVKLPESSNGRKHLAFSRPMAFDENRMVAGAALNNIADVVGRSVLIEVSPKKMKEGEEGYKYNRAKGNVENFYRFFVPVRLGNSDYTLVVTADDKKGNLNFNPKEVSIFELNPRAKERSPVGAGYSSVRDFHQLLANKASSNSIIDQKDRNVKNKKGWKRTQEARKIPQELPRSLTIRDLLTGLNDVDGNPYINEDGSGNFDLGEKSYEQGNRGKITFVNGRSIIEILKSADASTVIHELGHEFLESMADDILLEGATEQFKKDFAETTKWLGVTKEQVVNGRVEFTRSQHEKFAKGFEVYLHEGKAPSVGLKEVFKQFRKWLTKVFKKYAPAVALTPEVRQVFARIIATEDQIAEMRETEEFFSRKKEQVKNFLRSMGDEKAIQDYEEQLEKAGDEAEELLRAKTLDDLNADRQKWLDDTREKIKNSVEKELLEDHPVYRVLNYLKTAPESAKIMQGSFDGDMADVLVSKEGKMTAEDFAALAGFESVEDMAMAFSNTPKIEELVNQIVQAEMKELEMGILARPDELAEAAREAIYNDSKVDMLAAEAEILETVQEKPSGNEKINKVKDQKSSWRERAAIVKDTAKRIIGATPVNELSPYRYVNAARRHARRAMVAIQNGKLDQAAKAKELELLNAALANEAHKAQKEVDKIVGSAKALKKLKPVPGFNEDFTKPIQAIIEAYRLAPGQKKTDLLPPVVDMSSVVQFMEQQAKDRMIDIDLPEWLSKESIEQKDYRQMALDRVRDVHKLLKQIEYLGREEAKNEQGGRKKNFEKIRQTISETIFKNHKRKELGPFEDVNESWTKTIHYSHAKVEAIVDRLDGYEEMGPVWRAVIQPIVDGQGKQFTMMRDYRKNFAKILEKNFGESFDKESQKVYTMQLEGGRTYEVTGEKMLAMALNWGNEGNRDRLKKTLSPHGIGINEISQFLDDNMTVNHWNFVTDTWSMIDSYWPEIAALYKDWTGATPEKVLGSPIVTKFGVIQGGYYPIAYDPKSTRYAQIQEEKEAAADIMGPQYVSAATRNGHTKDRTGFPGGRLLLELDVIDRHINNVIQDLSFGRAVAEVNQIISHDSFEHAIKDTLGDTAYRQFRPWLVAVARPDPPLTNWGEKIARRARLGTTIVNMGFKVTTALVQPLGATMAVPELGAYRTAAALTNFYKDFVTNNKKAMELVDSVMEKSAFMADRAATFDRDINDTIRELKKSKILDPVHRYAFYMASMADLSITVPLWHEAYTQGLKKFKGVDEDAVRYADKVIRQSQGSGHRMDLAAIQRGSEFQKLVIMHYSFFSVLYNAFGRNYSKWRMGKMSFGQFASNLAWIWLIQGALDPLIRFGLGTLLNALSGTDDEDKDFGDALIDAGIETAKFPLGSVIILRDIANGIGPSGDRYSYKMSPVSSSFEAIKNMGNALQDGNMEKILKNSWLVAATIYGLLGRQVQASVGEILNWYFNDEDFSLKRFILGGR